MSFPSLLGLARWVVTVASHWTNSDVSHSLTGS